MLRSFLTGLLFSSALITSAQADACTANIENVASKLGEIVVFCGTPTRVSAPDGVKGGPVFISFGSAFPQKGLTAVIWEDVSGKEHKKLVKRYSGKSLRIRGSVEEVKGVPEIEVRSLKDVVVE